MGTETRSGQTGNAGNGTSILGSSSGCPIVVEVVDKEGNIGRRKLKLEEVMGEGLITEEEVNMVFYEGRSGREVGE